MNKVYAISDVHGNAYLFHKLLDTLQLDDTDTLFIIGDLIDRKKDGIALLKYIMDKKNIILIKGNHEQMMLDSFSLNAERKIDEYANNMFNIWVQNGGDLTLKAFENETKSTQIQIIKYLTTLPEFKYLTINDKKYLLSHAGLYIPNNWKKEPFESVVGANLHYQYHLWVEEQFLTLMTNPFPKHIDKIIAGHTPTIYLRDIIDEISDENKLNSDLYHIYKDDFKYIIDCGCNKKYGYLGCLCLNTLEEIYIK